MSPTVQDPRAAWREGVTVDFDCFYELQSLCVEILWGQESQTLDGFVESPTAETTQAFLLGLSLAG